LATRAEQLTNLRIFDPQEALGHHELGSTDHRAGLGERARDRIRERRERLEPAAHDLAVEAGAQRERLEKEKESLEKGIANHQRQLADEAFRAKAPEKVVAGMQRKLDTYQAQLAKVAAALGQP